MSGPRASQGRPTNEGSRKFRAHRSRSWSFFSSTDGTKFHQLNIMEMSRITTLRRPKGMDLNVRLKIMSLCLWINRGSFHTANDSSKQQQAPKPPAPKHSQPFFGGKLIVLTLSNLTVLIVRSPYVLTWYSSVTSKAEGIGARPSSAPPRPPHPGNVQHVHVPRGDLVRAFQISSCELKIAVN